MPNRVYSEINLHFVWHVKQSLPIISESIEPGLWRFLRSHSLKTEGLIFHEVGGIDDHLHIAVTIPPTVTISDWIGKLKAPVPTTLTMNWSIVSFWSGRVVTAWSALAQRICNG